jgi:iron uptake system EfeUOB component EfeO/EfeM
MEEKVDFKSDAFWSGVKRKDFSAVLAIAFTMAGEDEAAEIARNTTRMTDAAIKRMRDALGRETEVVEDSDKAIDPSELDYADEDNELIELTEGIEKAIKAGKKKKAKKLFKELKATGLKGSEMDKIKKAIKEL